MIMLLSSDSYKRLLSELIELLGSEEALRRLVAARMSPHTAYRLISGKYNSGVGAKSGIVIGHVLEEAKTSAS